MSVDLYANLNTSLFALPRKSRSTICCLFLERTAITAAGGHKDIPFPKLSQKLALSDQPIATLHHHGCPTSIVLWHSDCFVF